MVVPKRVKPELESKKVLEQVVFGSSAINAGVDSGLRRGFGREVELAEVVEDPQQHQEILGRAYKKLTKGEVV